MNKGGTAYDRRPLSSVVFFMEEKDMKLVNVLENEHLDTLNHSCAHVMAQAVKHLFPEAKFWVGPVIQEGFYYDIDLGDYKLKDEDIPKIEKEMKKIAKDGKRIVRHEISKEEAMEQFKDDPYKLDIISGLEGTISMYTQGDFTDLCRGPHVDTVKACRNFKLLKHSGAYWKGDANNKMLQRIYGICFDTKEELEAHLEALEEAKKRDHKRLGKEMGLFTLTEYAPGMPVFLPDGMVLRNLLETYSHDLQVSNGYEFINTPMVMARTLWERSGHWDHYKNNMYTTQVDDRDFAIKPMNCPGALLVYNSTLHSYKDLPLRLAEMGHVHRQEASGALNGLFRARTFTQDDCHIFVTPSQIEEEVTKIIHLIDQMYSVFGLEYDIELSTRPEEGYIGSLELWEQSETALAKACQAAGKDYKVNPGDGAFYGPKLDFHIRDSLNRVWQCGTVQLDMNLPERFEATYVESDGSKQVPIMIHRAIYGSFERFIGILIEHFGGHFPLWLSPKQFVVIPVHQEKHVEYANKVKDALAQVGMRVQVDARNEKLGYRVREAQVNKVPYQIVVGDGEMEDQTVTIRKSGTRESVTLPLTEAIERFVKEVDEKQLFSI